MTYTADKLALLLMIILKLIKILWLTYIKS